MALVARWKMFYPLVRFFAAMAIAVVLLRFPFYFLEGVLYDARVRWSPSSAISQKIVTIAIDEKTLAGLHHDPDSSDNIKLITQLQKENPGAIMYMGDPTKWQGTQNEKMEFAKQAGLIPNFYFTTEEIAPAGEHIRQKLAAPFDSLSLVPASVTRDNLTFAADKVTRRILISFDGQFMLQAILANAYNHIINPLAYRGSYERDGSVFEMFSIRKVGTYKPLSFLDARDGKFAPGTLKDKIVIIGRDTHIDSDDYIFTPYSREPLAMSKLEAQANIVDTLLLNQGMIRTPPFVNWILTILAAYITVILVWRARPINGILLILALGGVVTLLVYGLFVVGIWIKMIHPLLAIFVSYYFFIPYRLIVENRKTWEYAQKNRLLIQVEELKTNFLSMMSHDLKTPIARIQGMAETALREKSNLTTTQKEALKTILGSSDELGKFIGSILDLSRIESKEVKLQKTSRDINSILKEIIKKYEFNASLKQIKLVTKLDPLFSVKMDVELIRQVLVNLIENAIKYSPEGSTVIISSKEEENRIQVSVADTGPGIPQDEVDNIFLKFYRSKAAKASPVKGSGLGLYLAKYFVELHGGDIQVVSAPDRGSTFTVELPV